MHTIQNSYRSMSLFVDINWDRFLFPATIAVALMIGGFLGTLLTQ